MAEAESQLNAHYNCVRFSGEALAPTYYHSEFHSSPMFLYTPAKGKMLTRQAVNLEPYTWRGCGQHFDAYARVVRMTSFSWRRVCVCCKSDESVMLAIFTGKELYHGDQKLTTEFLWVCYHTQCLVNVIYP